MAKPAAKKMVPVKKGAPAKKVERPRQEPSFDACKSLADLETMWGSMAPHERVLFVAQKDAAKRRLTGLIAGREGEGT